MVGAIAAINKGKTQMLQFGLVDPSHKHEEILATRVIKKFHLAGKGETIEFEDGKTPEDIAEKTKRKGLNGIILDVQTLGWSYIYRLDLKYGIY